MLLTYNLADRGTRPLYEYLYRCLRLDIEQGRLVAGEKLPSKRALAAHLNISVVTVENSYAQLIAEGYLVSREKSGYFVSEVFPASSHPSRPAVPAEVTFSSEHVLPEKESWLVDLTSNEIKAELFPFSVWSKLSREVLASKQQRLLERVPTEGVWELRQAIADYLLELRGMQVSPKQILIGAGTEYLYQLMIQLFGRQAIVALEDPGYRKTMQIYEVNDCAYRFVPLDSQGICMEALSASGANLVHVSPAHHYPTGIVTSIGRRRELLEWAKNKNSRYILEDEYDSEFRFSGKPIPPLFSIDQNGKVIYMNTFSKSISPAIRISYLILPMELLSLFHERLGFYSCTVPSFEQYTLAAFIAKGYLVKHVNRMKNYYREVRNKLIAVIHSLPFSEQIHIQEEDAGLHFLMRIQTLKTDEEIIALAKQAGVRLQSLRDFARLASDHCSHTFVVNYSSLSGEALEEAGKRLNCLKY